MSSSDKNDKKMISPPRVISTTWRQLTWTDISYPTWNEANALGQKYNFHPLSLEDSVSRSQLSKLDDHGNYLLLILHFPKIITADQTLKSTWFCAFIGNDYIITLHDEFKYLTDLFEKCRTDEGVKKEYFTDSPGYLLYRILDNLMDYCFPILNGILSRMESIEDRVFDESGEDTKSIAVLRRDIITLRRIIWPSRSVVAELKPKIKPFTYKDLGVYFDNLLDQVNRIWDTLEESKDVIEVFKDSDFVLVTNRINRIVQTLTLLSSIVLPFLVVSSLYGMNVDLPGGIQMGSFESFGILLAIMFMISGSMLYFFHRRKWI